MGNNIGLPIKTGYIIKNDSYVKSFKHDGRSVETEVGDAKQPGSFKPQLKFKMFNNLINYSARYDTKGKPGTNTIEDGRIKYDVGDEVVEMFETGEGYEIGVTLKRKPNDNVFKFTLDTKDVVFYYQPDIESLPADERAKHPEHVEQPENVKGSYAVYAARRPGGVDYNEFKSGKVGHIYRPYAEDSRGNRVWCELKIDSESKLMTVTAPQDFLNNAVYPVFIDPDFGYTTIGGTSLGVYASTKNWCQNNAANHYTAGAGEQIDNFSVYTRVNTGSGLLEIGAYDMGVSNDPDGATLNSSADASITITSADWVTTSDVNSAITSGNKYAVAVGDSRPTGGTIYMYYDAGGAPNTMAETTTTGPLDSTFAHDDGQNSYIVSMYATVGAQPSAPVFSGTIPNYSGARTTPVSIQTASYFTSTDTFTLNGAPAFLGINASTGEITNVSANVNGTYAGISVTCTNAQGSDTSNTFSVTITAQAPVWTGSIADQSGNESNAITPLDTSLIVDHATSYSATGLPTGLTIDSGSGIISGTPSAQGTFAGAYVTATNSDGSVNSNTFTWTIGAPLPIPTITDVNSGNNLQRSASVVITGTNFETPQGTGTVTFNAVSLTVTAWSDTSITVTVPNEGFVFGANSTLEITNNSGYTVQQTEQFVPEAGYSFSTLSVSYSQIPTDSILNGVVGLESLVIGDQVMYQTAASPEGTVSLDDEAVPTITGATAAGDYTFNYLLNDVSDLTVSSNGTAVVTLQGSDADVFAPSWVSSPAVNTITTTGATLAATINETGSIYAVVVLQSAATPTTAQVKLGQDSTGSPAVAAVSALSNTALSAPVSGLTEDTAYKAVFVAEDDETTPNAQASVTSVNFTTVAEVDNTPPSFVVSPAVSQVTQTTCVLNASIDEPGTIAWVIIPANYPDPTPSEVLSNQIVSPSSEIVSAEFAGSGSVITDLSVTGLTSGTDFKAVFAAQDADSNAQLTSTIRTFTTSQSGTSRSVTDVLKDPETGALVANTTIDYQLQPAWGTANDIGQFTTDANGNFTINNLASAAGAARLIIKSTDGVKGGQKDVTITEA